MPNASTLSPDRFEDNVRQAADAVWNQDPGTCQPHHYYNVKGVTELDGRIEDGHVLHLLMMTTRTDLKKAREDFEKLTAAKAHEKKSSKTDFVKLWLITETKLNAEHIREGRSKNVTVQTLEEFRNQYFNGSDYLNVRENAPFGSARDPDSDAPDLDPEEYVPLPMTVTEDVTTTTQGRPTYPITIGELKNRIDAGAIVVLVAPFGGGKSMTTREVFLELMKDHRRDGDRRTPLALSLREHSGQDFAPEILDRHARSVGFKPPEDLVKAWRGGMATLLLDGFDEVTPNYVIPRDNPDYMRDARRQALEGVRQVVKQRGRGTGVLLVGRDHFFSDLNELRNALGLGSRAYDLVRLDEFTKEGAERYLQKKGIDVPLPDWLPTKPLFLGWLARQGLLVDAVNIPTGRGHIWEQFLDLMCQRDADLAGLDGPQIRRVLELLACSVRATTSGTGPITAVELDKAFRQVTGQAPDNAGLSQLNRLPGLTPREKDPRARSFIDEELLAALQGSALVKVMTAAAKLPQDGAAWLDAMPQKAVATAAEMLREYGMGPSDVVAAARNSALYEAEDIQPFADAIAVAVQIALDIETRLEGQSITIEGATFEQFDLEEVEVSGLNLESCYIKEVVIGPRATASSIVFDRCSIGQVSGVAGPEFLPEHLFQHCDVEAFDELDTNNAVQQQGYPAALTALVVTLRKLYLQPGKGRKLSAFKRGFVDEAAVAHVDGALRALKAEGMVYVSPNKNVHPVRGHSGRALGIIQNPLMSEDPLAIDARA